MSNYMQTVMNVHATYARDLGIRDLQPADTTGMSVDERLDYMKATVKQLHAALLTKAQDAIGEGVALVALGRVDLAAESTAKAKAYHAAAKLLNP